jgi:hypothetical protein
MNGWIFTKNQGRMAAVPPMLTNETLMGSDRVHFFFRASTKPFQRSAKTAAKIARVAASNFQMFEFPILSFHQKRPQRFFSWPRPISPQPLKHTTGTGAESHISHASHTESEHLARRRQCTTVPPRHHSLLTRRCSVREDVVKQAGAASPTKAHTAPFVLHRSRRPPRRILLRDAVHLRRCVGSASRLPGLPHGEMGRPRAQPVHRAKPKRKAIHSPCEGWCLAASVMHFISEHQFRAICFRACLVLEFYWD